MYTLVKIFILVLAFFYMVELISVNDSQAFSLNNSITFVSKTVNKSKVLFLTFYKKLR